MSDNLYYRNEIGGPVITITPKDVEIMARQTGKTMLTLKLLAEASPDPDNAPVIKNELVLINIEDAKL